MKKEWSNLTLAAANLSRASNGLNDIIERAELALQQLNLGIPAWSVLVLQGDYHWSLGYAKVESRWCLAIRQCKVHTNSTKSGELDYEEIPLNRATRDLKTKAILSLPELLRELNRQAVANAAIMSKNILLTIPILEAMEATKATRKIKKKGG